MADDRDTHDTHPPHQHPPHQWWLEEPGERTAVDRFAEAHDRPGHPEHWDVVVEERPIAPRHLDLLMAAAWMVAIVLLLSWLPIFNGFLAGVVGGWWARSTRRALAASVLSVVVYLPLLWLMMHFTGFQNRYFDGLGLGWWVLVAFVSTLFGAWLATAGRWAIREEQGPVRRWVGGPWADPTRRDYLEG